MKKQKHVEFVVGFLSGVLLTVFCWRMLEGIYIREVLGVQPPARRIAQPAAAQAPAQSPRSAPADSGALKLKLSETEMNGPDQAPLTLTEYSDFFCPYCSRVAPAMDRLMEEFPGKIRRIFRHYPLPFHTGAERVHEASECAREQGKFWAFHHYVFSNMREVKHPDFLNQAAQAVSLDREAFKSCAESRKYESKVKQDIEEGSAKGVRGTPAAFINDFMISGAVPYETFQTAAEHFLDPKKPLPQVQGGKRDEPRPPVQFSDLEGKPSQGDKNALVTIVEFSDFHCPFCARTHPTIQKILQNYEGKVRLVWRHFPLPMHQGADQTHAASGCAKEQNKFWIYHDKIFENQGRLSQPDILNQLAQEAGLDLKAFQACLEKPESLENVRRDIASGQALGVQGTPTFFINGVWFVGAQPYEAFDRAIQEALKKA